MTKKFRIWGLVQDRPSPAVVTHMLENTGTMMHISPQGDNT